MDEPLSNLDARLRLTMRGEIKRLCQRLDDDALCHARPGRGADNGRPRRGHARRRNAAVAPPDEIYDRPANRFVATFVGNPPMNVLRAVVDRQACSRRLTIPLEPARRTACLPRRCEIGCAPRTSVSSKRGRPSVPRRNLCRRADGSRLVDLRVGDEHLSVRAGRGFPRRSAPSSAYVRSRERMLLRRDGSPRWCTVKTREVTMSEQNDRDRRSAAGTSQGRGRASPCLDPLDARGGGDRAGQGRQQESRHRRLRRRRPDAVQGEDHPARKGAGFDPFLEENTASRWKNGSPTPRAAPASTTSTCSTIPGCRSSAPRACLRTWRAGIDGTNKDWIKPMIDMGYWPPQKVRGSRASRRATPKLVTVPFVGDLQTLTYRNDVYTTALRPPGTR